MNASSFNSAGFTAKINLVWNSFYGFLLRLPQIKSLYAPNIILIGCLLRLDFIKTCTSSFLFHFLYKRLSVLFFWNTSVLWKNCVYNFQCRVVLRAANPVLSKLEWFFRASNSHFPENISHNGAFDHRSRDKQFST